jgi:hypothetical protein
MAWLRPSHRRLVISQTPDQCQANQNLSRIFHFETSLPGIQNNLGSRGVTVSCAEKEAGLSKEKKLQATGRWGEPPGDAGGWSQL